MAKHLASPTRPSFLAAERRVARAARSATEIVFYHVVALVVLNGVLALAKGAHHLPVIGAVAALMSGGGH